MPYVHLNATRALTEEEIASIREASSPASRWRTSVALQIVQWLSSSRTFCFSTPRISSHRDLGNVVWQTATALSVSGSSIASAASATIRTSPWAHPAVPRTSG